MTNMTLSRSAALAFAWSGGVMFVGSLAWFVFFYYMILDHRPAPSSRLVLHLALDVLLFTAFAAHHSIFARSRVKQFIMRWVPAALERSFYVWIASTLFIVVCMEWRPIPGPLLYELSGWRAWLAHGIQAGALLFTARAAGVLDPLELAGIRQAYGHRTSTELRVVGPYRWIRHPVYLGWIVFVFSASSMAFDRLTFAVISTAYVLIAIPWEERSIVRSLGDSYREYKRVVKWRVVPYVY